MGVLKRVRDITVANLNDRLERSEDPVRLIDHFLLTTRQEINEAEKLYHQYLGHANVLRKQKEQAKSLKEKREEQAILALKAEEDQIAKMALHEKMLQEEKYEQYSSLYDQSKQALLELEDHLNLLKQEYQAVYDKRQYYAARMESVRLQQRMNQKMGSYGNTSVPRMFDRLEERVTNWELEARSMRDLKRMGQEIAYQAGTTLQITLDRELDRLKEKLYQSRKE